MPSNQPALTQARLKELLYYDPETGHFTWRVSRGVKFASIAGSPNREGYIKIQIDGLGHYAHRLSFLYMTGALPPEHVDHINRVKDDNSWPNLRPATKRDNAGNVGLRGDNTSGHRGVCWHKHRGKWQARGMRDGRKIHLGYYTSLEEAAAVAKKFREERWGEFAPQD